MPGPEQPETLHRIDARRQDTPLRVSHESTSPMPTHNKHRRPDLRLRAAALLALAALAVAVFAFSAPAQAQDDTDDRYVDLLMLFDRGDEVEYSVMNIGTAKATGVTVSFLLEDLQLGSYQGAPYVPGRTTENGTNERFTRYVGTILPGETKTALIFCDFM